jgi:hypothetical protein
MAFYTRTESASTLNGIDCIRTVREGFHLPVTADMEAVLAELEGNLKSLGQEGK